MPALRPIKRPSSLQPLVVPYLHAAETHTSLDRRMIAMLINCVAEKTNTHSDTIRSVAFSRDGTKIVSGSFDKTIKVCRL
jgi:WD40 repeat protein